MYADPKKVKSHIVKVRLDDRTNEQIDALVTLTGDQKAVLTRALVLKGLKLLHSNNADELHLHEVPEQALMEGR